MKEQMAARSPGKTTKGINKVTLSNDFLQSSLARCVSQQNSTLALLCLDQSENPHVRCQTTGRTLMHHICTEANPMTEAKYVPLVYVLSNAGVDLDLPDHQQVTPLQLAIRCGLLEVMTALLKCGAQCQGDEEELAERHGGLFFSEFVTTLRKLWPGYWQAVKQNNTFRVNKLVKSWCRINLNRGGLSLIEYARTTAEDPKLIKHLVDNEASIELAHAVIAGDAERMRVLLCNQSVDLNTKDLSHKENFFEAYCPLTLFGAALKYGHKHLLEMLRTVKDSGKMSDLEEAARTRGGRENGERGGQDLQEVEGDDWISGKESKSVVCTIL